ncbi:MAG: energy transducer TonB [Acidobacteriota bacterium]
MFDLITGTGERPLRERSVTSTVVAVATHAVVIIVVIAIPLLRVTNQLPELPTMRAFLVAPAAPPPPPPPPPPPAAPSGARAAMKKPVAATTGQFAAPVDAPHAIEPERLIARDESIAGALGGVEGGVPGGVAGGVVGGILSSVAPPPPPPPPPPPAPATRGPVRIGGQITAPALLTRVEPTYPDIAQVARLSGIVILEATVGTDGCVESVRILRSRHLLLDKASEEALRQWRYSPLVLNGFPTPFVLTVTFNFSVPK